MIPGSARKVGMGRQEGLNRLDLVCQVVGTIVMLKKSDDILAEMTMHQMHYHLCSTTISAFSTTISACCTTIADMILDVYSNFF